MATVLGTGSGKWVDCLVDVANLHPRKLDFESLLCGVYVVRL